MIFTEKQTYTRGWMLILLLFLISLVALPWIVYFQGIETDIVGAVIGSSIGFLLSVFFVTLSLHSRIDATGVHYQYKPVHRKERTIAWSEIQTVEVKTYRPLRDYGGWGLRFRGFDSKDILLNVSGRTGIYLVTKDGRKIMLGTQKAEEAQKVLEHFGHKA